MKLRKLKFSGPISTGGNMRALEAYRRGHQILLSDCFGDAPKIGQSWSASIYRKDRTGDFSEDPCASLEGKNYDPEKAESLIRELLKGVLVLSSLVYK